MNTRYNFYNLEASFRSYLIAENITPVTLKNYLSDYRHFMGWMTLHLSSQEGAVIQTKRPVIPSGSPVIPSEVEGSSASVKPDLKNAEGLDSSPSIQNDIVTSLTLSVIEAYKSYLVENNIPLKTINRRLSTVRKFCSFCISQGWMKENPGKRVGNVIPAPDRSRGQAPAGYSPFREIQTKNWIPYQVRDDAKTQDDVLSQFEGDLNKQQTDRHSIANYLTDIKEFLVFLSQ